VTDEVAADLDGVREPAWCVLLDVRDLDAPPGAVADGGPDFGMGVTDDDADVADAGLGNRLDAVEEHRLVGDRHELLGAGVGQGAQTRAFAATQNQSLHVWSP